MVVVGVGWRRERSGQWQAVLVSRHTDRTSNEPPVSQPRGTHSLAISLSPAACNKVAFRYCRKRERPFS